MLDFFLNKCAGVSNRFFQHTLLSEFPVSSSWGSSIVVLFSKLGCWVDGLHVQLASQLPSRLLCRALQNQNLCEQLRISWRTTDTSKRFMPMFASVLLIRGTRPVALLSSRSVISLLQLKLKFQIRKKKGKRREEKKRKEIERFPPLSMQCGLPMYIDISKSDSSTFAPSKWLLLSFKNKLKGWLLSSLRLSSNFEMKLFQSPRSVLGWSQKGYFVENQSAMTSEILVNINSINKFIERLDMLEIGLIKKKKSAHSVISRDWGLNLES